MSDDSATNAARIGLPTRIIGYAWGDSYVDELLNLAIPALLAPGNLPAIASQVPCELVLVSEERLFAKISGHRAVKAVQKLCPVRLLGLDDLITRSDKYGMALTYALHRAFADLGRGMTDAWLIFFNADFILADGSLRNLLGHLMRGERIVASPSYCTVKEDIVPELKQWLVPDPRVLAIPPREMAELILRHRHITIRGKTINQNRFHLLQADQFYWQVDDKTLIGQQMPIAVVGMRPQRYLAEPNAFWDHGLMLELCPDAEVRLLGDSDEFLMLELRSGGVAQEQIVLGPAEPRDLAERMITWVTPYQVSFAHRPLVLHAADVPPSAEVAHKELDAFVTKVLSFAPKFPSHLDHPQWEYHWPDFMKIRHAFLSTKLELRTVIEPPPAAMLPIDRLWWRLDGAEKSHAQRMKLFIGKLEEIDCEIADYANAVLDEVATPDLEKSPTAGSVFAKAALHGGSASAQNVDLGRAVLNEIELKLAPKYREAEHRKAKIRLAIAAAEQEYAAGESGELQKARSEYEQLLRSRVKSAGIPIVHWRARGELERRLPVEPAALAPSQPFFDSQWFQPWLQVPWQLPQESPSNDANLANETLPRHIARAAYYRVFGRWPRVTMLNPFWACAQPLLAAIEAAKARGAGDVLAIVDAPGIFPCLSSLSGKIAHLSPGGFAPELFAKALEPHQQFDLCVLQLSADDIPRLSELVTTLAPYMRMGGTIVGFYMNAGRPVGALRLDHRNSRVAFTGSAASMRAIGIYSAAFNYIYQRRLFSVARGLLQLALSMPLVWWANRAEKTAARKGRVPGASFRTSVTVVIQPPRMMPTDGDVKSTSRLFSVMELVDERVESST